MADNKFVTLEALKSTAARLQQEWLKSISKAGHARFEVAEAIPDASAAQENIMYLVMNDKTQHYDIYAKVNDEVVLLDDTTVDLSGYATKEQLEAVSGGLGGTVYAATKADLSTSDDSVISGYFAQNTDVKPKKGDVFVVTTTVDGSTYEQSAYFYDGSAWVAMTGSVDADKVILRENITLAGGYTQVGNLTKSQNGTATFSTKGKSVMDALTEIFSKRLQPSITAQPSIGTFTLTGAGAVEAGTKVAAAAYSGATLNAGSYQYGPATGATDPKLAGKPVMVLAVKGQKPDSCTYSFLDMSALVDTYKAKATGKDASTTITVSGYEIEVKVNVSAAAGNALSLKADGLYVDISGKADKVKNATSGNFAALDANGNLTDSGKKPADFVAAETGKRLMTDAEGTKLDDIAEGATKVEKSATNGNVKINGVETAVYTEPSDVIHGTVASDEDVTAMLTEVFGA